MTERRAPYRVKREPTPRELIDEQMSERAFQQIVNDLLRIHGWLCHHGWTELHSEPGFPDICALRGNRLVFAELKSERGKLTEAQEHWRVCLLEVPNVECYIWRPSDWKRIVEAVS